MTGHISYSSSSIYSAGVVRTLRQMTSARLASHEVAISPGFVQIKGIISNCFGDKVGNLYKYAKRTLSQERKWRLLRLTFAPAEYSELTDEDSVD